MKFDPSSETWEQFWGRLTYKQRQWIIDTARERGADKNWVALRLGVPEDKDIFWTDGGEE